MRLTDELHVRLVLDADGLDLHALGGEHAPSLGDLRRQDRACFGHVHAQKSLVDGADEIMANVGDETAERRRDARARRDEHLRNRQLTRERNGVKRPGAAEGEQDEVARVAPALQRHQPDGAGHLVVGHAHDGGGGRDRIERQMRADLLVDDVVHLVEPSAAFHAEQRIRIQPAEEEIGVGDRGLLAPAAVGDGAGLGARALRSHVKNARARHASDRAAAGADGVDVDHGHAHGQTVAHLLVGAHRGRPAHDHADVEAGAAHVARDHVGVAGRERRMRSGLHAGGGPRHERVDGVTRGHVDGHRAAVALHHQQLVPVALAGQLAGEPPQIAIDHRLDEAVDGRRGPALELAVLGKQLRPDGHVCVRPLGGGHVAGSSLVRVVDVGVDEVDHQRLDAAVAEPRRGAPDLVLVERRHHVAFGVHPLGDFEAQLAWDERLERALEPVRCRPCPPPQFEDVAESTRGDEAGAGAFALEERVRGRRGAVDDDLQVGGRRRRVAERGQDTVGLIADGRRHLGHAHGARRFVEQHQIGEGATDVDADEERSHGPFLYRRRPGEVNRARRDCRW